MSSGAMRRAQLVTPFGVGAMSVLVNGLRITLGHFNTRELQERALAILQFKLDLLWSMLDAMLLAHCPVQIEGWGAYTPMTRVAS